MCLADALVMSLCGDISAINSKNCFKNNTPNCENAALRELLQRLCDGVFTRSIPRKVENQMQFPQEKEQPNASDDQRPNNDEHCLDSGQKMLHKHTCNEKTTDFCEKCTGGCQFLFLWSSPQPSSGIYNEHVLHESFQGKNACTILSVKICNAMRSKTDR